MNALSPLDRTLLLASVGGMFASLAFYAAARTAKYWKRPFVRFARESRTVQAIVLAGLLAVTALGGGKTNAPPLRLPPRTVRTIPAEDLPAWFVALGYPATDADESGIPDCWEKWTHTRGFAAEADPDGDGLSNLAEFEAQTDPIRADTDGDGIDDATELAGLAAGVADLNPLVAATFVANEPDADGDGIPDIWEAAEILSFDGFAPDGFPWGIDVPEPAATNFDVTVHVSSSRHAALSWGDGWGESILLPPCTNLALRLRLAADGVKTLALSPGPDAATSPVGTWRAALVADWDLRRGFPTEIDRLALPDGTMVDRSERESIVSMAWMQAPARRSGEPLRGGRGGRKPEITFTPRRVFLFVENDSFCSIHGPAPTVRVVAENASPPYVWTERGVSTTTQTDSFMPSNPYPDGHYEVSVVWPDEHETLFLQAPIRLDPITCRPGQTNFVGAGWTSTHNPTNAADHAPGVVEVDRTFGPLCPVAHDVDVRLGWTHDTAILWIRNLVRIVTGDPMDDETDHCISLPFSQTGEIDLYSYLDGVCLPYRERFVFKVNGLSLPGHTIHMSDYRTDNNLKPSVLHVSFSFGGSREMDRMWIVLYSSDLKTGYDSWKTKFSGLTWTTSLPPVYPSIALSTNGNGAVSLVKQDYPGWERPHAISSYLHHDAVYEMRSESVGIHGHQATYRADGTVIETTLAAGTADYSHPLSTHAHWPTLIQDDHYVNDVVPFLRALSLDGNPGIYNSRYIPTNLTRPCLYQGININEYILRRPTFPTGKH